MPSLRERSCEEEALGIYHEDEQEVIAMMRYVLGALIGDEIGGFIGYLGKCGGSG